MAPIYSQVYSGWKNTRGHSHLWHRTDFFSEMVREATGKGANIGACGDAIPGQANFQASYTVSQAQQSVQGSSASASRLQGVQIANTHPTNGQVLVYDSATNSYVPTTPPTGGGASTLATVYGNMTVTLNPTLYFSIMGAYTSTTETNTSFNVPYSGNLKNFIVRYDQASSNTVTMTLRLNETNTALSVSNSTNGVITLTNNSTVVPVTQGERLDFAITTIGAPQNITMISMALELDHA